MRRTRGRPLPTGRITATNATIFAVCLGVASFAVLYVFANPLAAWLSLFGNVYYVGIYTMWLKRRTPLNIVIGGAAGAVPPLVGWAAVTGHIGGPALGLFALIFLWTPPHTWALALVAESDYDKAHVPMLPNVVGEARTKVEIVAYTAVLVVASLALYPLHVMGLVYFVAALVLGGIFFYDALKTLRESGKIWPRRMFTFSLLYLALMCAAMVADRIFLA